MEAGWTGLAGLVLLQYFSFTASNFAFITRHIHNWAPFKLWPSRFTFSGAISNFPLLFPSNTGHLLTWGTHSSFCVISFCLFIQFMSFSWQVYWNCLPFPPLMGHILSELSTMTHPSWVALHSVAYGFIELRKPLCHSKAVIHEGEQELSTTKLLSIKLNC